MAFDVADQKTLSVAVPRGKERDFNVGQRRAYRKAEV
jgi:hypothetical protein